MDHFPIHTLAVWSDVEDGKKRSKDDDIVETYAHELRDGLLPILT